MAELPSRRAAAKGRVVANDVLGSGVDTYYYF